MAKQTEEGKAFEYACVNAFYEKYHSTQEVVIEESPQFYTAKNFFEAAPEEKRANYMYAANAAVNVIEALEPQLTQGNSDTPLVLGLQTDAQGIAGDVRDVLCIRKKSNWQIGLSCKHNHHAVKHSRLSATIDFGKDWFDKCCSQEYFDRVSPLFSELREIRDRSKAEGNPAQWDNIEDKFERYYVPILQAFMDELRRLSELYPEEIPELLIRYLIGRYDFYKVITNDARRTTTIQAVNLSGTLNKPAKKIKAIVNVPKAKMPKRFVHIGFKPGSQTTMEIFCDEAWIISMRLHNASSKVEPSLKFDVQLEAIPNSIHSQVAPWDYEYVRYTGDAGMVKVADDDKEPEIE
ncbi:MAG: HaeIII family restriction endonuclease [Parabacteroides sp.]|nr:HaeIII family restriction endonuclease [Parabacteroides sp.]